jgi:hypothetical protein
VWQGGKLILLDILNHDLYPVIVRQLKTERRLFRRAVLEGAGSRQRVEIYDKNQPPGAVGVLL